ncbi:hypothetical protein [Ferrimicrobium sp.]|uniref:hypothetical protein n=1 Tax=Ferrimicrobium sp. TaxID=2926050 RepID=UPI0026172BA3|nr:hypothetical protein [Ferrimicrobium sp.]
MKEGVSACYGSIVDVRAIIALCLRSVMVTLSQITWPKRCEAGTREPAMYLLRVHVAGACPEKGLLWHRSVAA